MARTLTGQNVPGGGAIFATDNAPVGAGGGHVPFFKIIFGQDGVIKFVEDATGQRMPVKSVFSDISDAEVRPGDATLNALRVNLVGGASVAEFQIDNAPYATQQSGGVPSHVIYHDLNVNRLTEGNAGAMRGSKDRLLHMLGAPRTQTIAQSTQMPASTAETTILNASAAGIFNDLTFIGIYNSNATTPVTVSLRDSTGGAIVYRVPLSEKGGSNIQFGKDNWPQTLAASNWTASLSAAVATVFINVLAVRRVS